jgi:branched-chain amino acid aminotransferase
MNDANPNATWDAYEAARATEREGVKGYAYVDGTYMPLAEATIPIVERGFLRSDVTYDAIHVWQGRIFRLHDHIARFRASIAGLKMSLPHTDQQIADIVVECTRRQGLRDAFIMLICTRGMPWPGSRDPRMSRNRLYAYAQPFVRIATEQQQQDGLKMILPRTQRIPSAALDQRIKNFHWLDLTMSLFEAYDRGADVTVLPTADGAVTEGPGFNVFVVKNGVLATPDHNMFEGITRRTVTEIAADLQVKCEIRRVRAEELAEADEIFICSTAGGIAPVTVFDGKPVGTGRPGALTTRLTDVYWQRHADPAFSTAVDFAPTA